MGPVAQVVHADVEDPAVLRLAGQREPQRSEVLGEDRDDVDTHAQASSSDARIEDLLGQLARNHTDRARREAEAADADADKA
jgi:hypothetical protein